MHPRAQAQLQIQLLYRVSTGDSTVPDENPTPPAGTHDPGEQERRQGGRGGGRGEGGGEGDK